MWQGSSTGLSAHDVSVERGGRGIIQGVRLSTEPGDFYALIGPNGSGKSTLLRALAGLWSVSRGEVTLDGVPIGSMDRTAMARRVSFVPQDTQMDFAFTVEEVVSMGRHPHRGRFERESASDRRAVAEALEQCDIGHLRRQSVTTLSGGERQRTLIARALAARPDYILLDEPTASLDIDHSLEVLDLCTELVRQGSAIVLATHDLTSVARVVTHVAIISTGRMVGCGPCDEVLTPTAIEATFGVGAEMLIARDGRPVFTFQRQKCREVAP